ncbi:hypothetical protein [Blautia obeum]|jgi:hypothetical protein|uniref:hypothetical protein n=1 Tax=Blautia obeum TaxID=40520 RepID=UPI0021089043|nr:hypothetical protein [Blautia obeum]
MLYFLLHFLVPLHTIRICPCVFSDQQLRWLLEGLNPEQPKAVQKWLPHKSENTENP